MINNPHEEFISLPKRNGMPSSNIFTKQYVNENLGDRSTIILLPGGPGNDMGMYDDPTMSIAQTFFQVADIILFDPRGCGRSDPYSVQLCSLQHYIDDIEAIRTYFNIPPDRFFVFGQSYGSIAALGYATCYPDSLKKLLIIGGVVDATFYDEAKINLKKIGSPEQIKFSEKLWNGKFDGSKEEIADFYRLMSPLYAYSFEPGEPPLEIGYNVDIMNYGWGTFLKKFDIRDKIPFIKCETLVLWGENEWIMPKSHIDYISKNIPNCQLKTYPKCMHMLWMDQWEMFVRDSLEFFAATYLKRKR